MERQQTIVARRPLASGAAVAVTFASIGVVGWLFTCPMAFYSLFPVPGAAGILAVASGLVAIRQLKGDPGLRGARHTAAAIVLGLVEVGLVIAFIVVALLHDMSPIDLLSMDPRAS